MYASPAWSGFCSASDVSKIDRYLNRCKRLNYCSLTTTCTELFDKADRSLFQTVLSDKHHVLNRLLPASETQQYNLRPRSHNLTLTCKSTFYDNCNFNAMFQFNSMLFKESYWHFCVIWTLTLFVTANRIVATFYLYCIAVCHCINKPTWWWCMHCIAGGCAYAHQQWGAARFSISLMPIYTLLILTLFRVYLPSAE